MTFKNRELKWPWLVKKDTVCLFDTNNIRKQPKTFLTNYNKHDTVR